MSRLKILRFINPFLALLISISALSCMHDMQERDWPHGLSSGSNTIIRPVELRAYEKTDRRGFDYWLEEKEPIGGKEIVSKISLPAGSTVIVKGFRKTSSYGNIGWWIVGEYSPNGSPPVTFSYFAHYGSDKPDRLNPPWTPVIE